MFETEKVTKQGDPLSRSLLNTVLRVALKDDLAKWQRKGAGIRIWDSESDCRTNLRLAENVLSYATSLEPLQQHVVWFQAKHRKSWIEDTPWKTKILSNQSSSKKQEVTISIIKVEVLLVQECAKYLGQTITFQQQEKTESKSRIRAALASFCRYKQELTSRSYPLQPRLRLLNMVLSPTLGYACGTWTLTNEQERLIL